MRVPLVLRLPGDGAPRGLRVSTQVSLVDVMPTLAELFGLDVPATDGVSLVPLLEGGEIAGRSLFGETLYPLFYRWSPSFSIRLGAHKFIQAPDPELYDLDSDPAEQQNLLEQRSEQAARLRSALTAQMQRWAAQDPTSEQAESLQSLQALAALGYAAGAAVDPDSAGPLPDAKDRVEVYEQLATAMAAVRERRWREARRTFESILEADPGNPSAHLNLGDLLAQQGDFRGAVEHLQACLEVSPSNRMAKATLGIVYFSWRRLDEAQALFDEILEQFPRSPEPMFFLGQVHEQRGDPATALEWYEQAAELMPGIPGLQQRITQLRRKLGGD
jgi:tetratricopeptide (TPR) repeat protein